jgi:hypothetical protein
VVVPLLPHLLAVGAQHSLQAHAQARAGRHAACEHAAALSSKEGCQGCWCECADSNAQHQAC